VGDGRGAHGKGGFEREAEKRERKGHEGEEKRGRKAGGTHSDLFVQATDYYSTGLHELGRKKKRQTLRSLPRSREIRKIHPLQTMYTFFLAKFYLVYFYF
jgi:hypothetical protein